MWQAGPRGSTVTTSASLSQSVAMCTTRCVLPLVAPLCHSSLRLRLQNQVSPVSRVFCERLLVHVGEREHGAGAGVADDGGDEAVGEVRLFIGSGIPSAARWRLTSATVRTRS